MQNHDCLGGGGGGGGGSDRKKEHFRPNGGRVRPGVGVPMSCSPKKEKGVRSWQREGREGCPRGFEKEEILFTWVRGRESREKIMKPAKLIREKGIPQEEEKG